MAVPLFFFFSGFLFFKGVFNIDTYKSKIKRRVRTLLVPYIFWNLAVALMFFALQTFFPNMTSGNTKLLADYTITEWVRVFWDKPGGMPICFQFWFIRDLMVVMLLSPLLYLGVKYLKNMFIIALGILWFFEIWYEIPGFSISAFFFFTAGAYFNIMNQSFILKMRPFMKYAIILYPILCCLCLFYIDTPIFIYFQKISIVVGITGLVALTAVLINQGRWKINEFLSESSFFIYAYHAMLLALIVKIGVKVFSDASSIGLLAIYFGSVFLIIVLGLILYYILKKIFPTFTNIITGNR